MYLLDGGVTPAEWQKFRAGIFWRFTQGMGEDEATFRAHVLKQLPENWRLAVLKQGMRKRRNTFAVKIGVTPGADANQLFEELAKEVDGLRHFEMDGRGGRVEFPTRDAQNHLLKLDGGFWQIGSGQHRLMAQIDEPQCTVDELCQIVEQQVEEMEAIEEIFVSRHGVKQEIPLTSQAEATSSRIGQST